MEEYVIILEEWNNSFLARQSHIVPKRVYDAINVLINPTREDLVIGENNASN